MKENYAIFVEGIADKQLIRQLIETIFKTTVPTDNIIATNMVILY